MSAYKEDIVFLSAFQWLSHELSNSSRQIFPKGENELSTVAQQQWENSDALLKLHKFFCEFRGYEIDCTDIHLRFWKLDPTLCHLAVLNGEIIGMPNNSSL